LTDFMVWTVTGYVLVSVLTVLVLLVVIVRMSRRKS